MPKKRFFESLEGPGFRLTRQGRFISVDSRRTPEEHRALLGGLADYHRQLPEILRTKVDELERLVARFDPLDVIANVALKNIFANPETYKEYAHQGLQAHVEYIALLCLKSPFRTSETRLIDGRDLDKLFTLLDEILKNTIWFYGTEDIDPGREEPPGIEQELRFKTILSQLVVRNPGYPHHLEDFLRGVFGSEPAATWIRSTLGFTVAEAILLSEAAGSLVQDKLKQRAAEAQRQARDFRAAVRRFRKSREAPDTSDTELLARLGRLKDKKLQGEVKRIAVGWLFYALGDTYSFTPAELAAAANIDEAKAERFLDTCAIEFEAVKPDFTLPAPTHPLQQTPVIRHPNGYLCPVPSMVHWAIRPRLEALMKADVRLWERYQKVRASFLVNEALRLIGVTIKRGRVFRNLSYTVDTPTGPQRVELDGMITFDAFLFLIEAKAGEFTPPARRGAPLRMKDDLRELSRAATAEYTISPSSLPMPSRHLESR